MFYVGLELSSQKVSFMCGIALSCTRINIVYLALPRGCGKEKGDGDTGQILEVREKL